MRVAVIGCTHGELDATYDRVTQLNRDATCAADKIRLILCCGDFESLRNAHDLGCKACPPRYRHMNAFPDYYSGKKHAPVLTIFIGGNHEASNYLRELHYGGWVAPNIFYLGAAGVINVAGLRLAGISGIYSDRYYKTGHFEQEPYTGQTVKSVFCVRELEVFQLSHLQSDPHDRIDAFLSHDWPRNIEQHGDMAALLTERPDFLKSIEKDRFGSPASEILLHALRPRRWLAGHMHVRFTASVPHVAYAGEPPTTEFLAQDKCKPGKACLEVVDVPATESMSTTENDDDALRIMFDIEWLAILRKTHRFAGRARKPHDLPAERVRVTSKDLKWVEKRLDEVARRPEHLGKRTGEWITDFAVTAPALGQEDAITEPRLNIGNPQTDAILQLLQLEHTVTNPCRSPRGSPASLAADAAAANNTC